MKNDPSTPPTDASAIQAVTPSDVFSWPGPGEHLTQSSERTGIENNWFALTGRVVDVKVEMDGDLHLALQDATGDKAGIVVCEIPAKQHQHYAVITEENVAEVFGHSEYELPRALAAKLLEELTGGHRTSCYRALRLNGRFARHLRTDGRMLFWR